MDPVARTILKTAIKDFSVSGVDDVALIEIAFDASTPLATLTSLYPTKNDLIEGVVSFITQYLEHFFMTPQEIEAALKNETPEELLIQFLTSYGWDDDALLESIYRMLYIELHTNNRISEFAFQYFFIHPVENIQTMLDSMIEFNAIPSCDSKALAEIWTRTAYIFGLITIQSSADYDDYSAIVKFFIALATKGVQTITIDQISLQWRKNSYVPTSNQKFPSVKDTIKTTALDLFSTNGYDNVPMSVIAKTLSMNLKDVYQQYRSKSHIIKDITSDLLDNRYNIPKLAFAAILENRDPLKLILTLSGAFPPIQENSLVKLYKILFREQFYNEELKDFFVSSILLDQETIQKSIENLVTENKIKPCDSKKIATTYVYTMCSLTAEEAIHPDHYEEIENTRLRIVALLVSHILYGYTL